MELERIKDRLAALLRAGRVDEVRSLLDDVWPSLGQDEKLEVMASVEDRVGTALLKAGLEAPQHPNLQAAAQVHVEMQDRRRVMEALANGVQAGKSVREIVLDLPPELQQRATEMIVDAIEGGDGGGA